MAIYPDLNLIFVHIPKTAGSAISSVLAEHALPRSTSLYRRATSHLPFAEPLEKVWLRQHLAADWMRVKLGAVVFDNFRRFAVVRNPYDRAVSGYEFARQRPSLRHHKTAIKQSFPEFLRTELDKRMLQAPMIYDAKDRLLVQEVLRFETLTADLARMCARWDLNIKLPEKLVNSSVRKPIDDYLTDEAVAIINKRATRDFDLLGYPRR